MVSQEHGMAEAPHYFDSSLRERLAQDVVTPTFIALDNKGLLKALGRGGNMLTLARDIADLTYMRAALRLNAGEPKILSPEKVQSFNSGIARITDELRSAFGDKKSADIFMQALTKESNNRVAVFAAKEAAGRKAMYYCLDLYQPTPPLRAQCTRTEGRNLQDLMVNYAEALVKDSVRMDGPNPKKLESELRAWMSKREGLVHLADQAIEMMQEVAKPLMRAPEQGWGARISQATMLPLRRSRENNSGTFRS